MNMKPVAKPLGLFLRAGVYQVRVMIPQALQPAYGGRTKVVRSLGTTNRKEADRLAAEVRLQLLAEFEAKTRELNPQPAAQLTPELGRTLGERIRASLLRWDEAVRDDPVLASRWLHFTDALSASRLTKLTIGAAPPIDGPLDALMRSSPFDGLSPSQLEKLAKLNQEANTVAGQQLAARNLSAVLPLADSEARRMGILIDWKAPEARPLLVECLRAYRAARTAIVERDEGNDIPTPLAPVTPPPPAAMRLREVYGRWKACKKRSEDTVNACGRALALYEQQTGNPPLKDLTRAQGDAFRAWLLQQDTSSKTARDRLTWVKSLLKYAFRDLEVISRNPWEGLDIEHTTETSRRPWTAEELKKLFEQPIYMRYELPRDAKAGGAAAYWIPLFGLFHGARVGELAQLQVNDVDVSQDFPTIRITNEGEGQRVKTGASVREVPIHSELIRLGFLDYVATVKESGGRSLWPALPLRKDKPGAYFSDWFGEYRKALGFGKNPDFHCFRHTVRTQLMEAEVAEPVIDRLMGHEVKGSTGARVYNHAKQVLRRALERVEYPELTLPRAFYPSRAPSDVQNPSARKMVDYQGGRQPMLPS